MRRLTFYIFLFLIFSLPFAHPFNLVYKGFVIQFTEILFLVNFLLFFASVLLKKIQLKTTAEFYIFGFYLFALLISAVFSENVPRSFIKLGGAVYLAGLFFLAFHLVNNLEKLKTVILVWLSASAIVAFLGTITVILFYINKENFLLDFTLHHYGTLIPGNYPRIQTTFYYPSMLCNYLTLGFAFLFIARENNWIGKKIFFALFFLISITLIFTITPGLGGIFVICSLFIRRFLKKKNYKTLPVLALSIFLLIAASFFAASIFSPVNTPTSPYYLVIPGIEKRVDPSVRLLAWQTSAEIFLENPLTGKGYGTHSANVLYKTASGQLQRLSDAHQIWLNVSAQAGIFGLLAIVLITFFYLRKSLAFLKNYEENPLYFYFAAAFLGAFLFQGFVGSFEDARHIWVFFGLFSAALKFGFSE